MVWKMMPTRVERQRDGWSPEFKKNSEDSERINNKGQRNACIEPQMRIRRSKGKREREKKKKGGSPKIPTWREQKRKDRESDDKAVRKRLNQYFSNIRIWEKKIGTVEVLRPFGLFFLLIYIEHFWLGFKWLAVVRIKEPWASFSFVQTKQQL